MPALELSRLRPWAYSLLLVVYSILYPYVYVYVYVFMSWICFPALVASLPFPSLNPCIFGGIFVSFFLVQVIRSISPYQLNLVQTWVTTIPKKVSVRPRSNQTVPLPVSVCLYDV